MKNLSKNGLIGKQWAQIAFAVSFLLNVSACGPNNVDNTRNAAQQLDSKQFRVIANTVEGFPIIVDSRDGIIAQILLKHGYWEPGISKAVKGLLKEGDTVVELGANYGYHTIQMSKTVGQTGHVHTYEANPDVCSMLHGSLALNDINNVSLNCLAISNEPGEVSFTVDYANLGASFVNQGDLASEELRKLKKFDHSKTFTVKKDKLDNNSLIKDSNVALLRMDIEGSELLAIQGAEFLFQNSPNLKIVMEWSVQQLNKLGNVPEMLDFLEAKGLTEFQEINNDTGELKTTSREEMLNPQHDFDVLITKNKKAL